ncbi:hypothetical protein ACQBAT_00315 [Ornithinimicrobium sp. Y1847]|uniref:hypothetical protein n=1 Tax=unclassified Ornithinimicrobium TaxID=2615080 RepID=UPI003B66CE9B
MTYEILLYPRTAGQSWDEVIANAEADTPDEVLGDEAAMAEGVKTWEAMEDRLREVLAGPVETWVAEETGGDVFGEAEAPWSGIKVELFHGAAAVSVDGDAADADVQEMMRKAVGIVASQTGYEPYDPQAKAPFYGSFVGVAGSSSRGAALGSGRPTDELGTVNQADLAGGLGGPGGSGGSGGSGAEVPGVGAQAPGAGAGVAGAAGAPGGRVDPLRDPTSLRRRGKFYFVLGALLLGLAGWRMSMGEATWLTYFLLILGVLEVLGGFMLMRRARYFAEQEAGGPAAS